MLLILNFEFWSLIWLKPKCRDLIAFLPFFHIILPSKVKIQFMLFFWINWELQSIVKLDLILGHKPISLYGFSVFLQICMNAKIRANAFSALGALSSYGFGTQHDAFLEQVF